VSEQSPRVKTIERLLAALGPDGARAALAKSGSLPSGSRVPAKLCG